VTRYLYPLISARENISASPLQISLVAFDPSIIIFGGGVSQVGPLLFDRVPCQLAERVFYPRYLENLKIEMAALVMMPVYWVRVRSRKFLCRPVDKEFYDGTSPMRSSACSSAWKSPARTGRGPATRAIAGVLSDFGLRHAGGDVASGQAKVVTASYPFTGFRDGWARWDPRNGATGGGPVVASGVGMAAIDSVYTSYAICMWAYTALLPGAPTPGTFTGRVMRPSWPLGATEPTYVAWAGP